MRFFTPGYLKGRRDETLPVQLNAYKYTFLWPLEEGASTMAIIVHFALALLSLAAYIGTVFAELTFMFENFSDIPAVTECLTTTCMGVQYTLKIVLWIKRQGVVRVTFNRFYKEIYFTAADDTQIHEEVNKKMRIPDFLTKLYFVTMFLIYIFYFWNLWQANVNNAEKPYIYRMSFIWYDAQKPLAYFITALYTGWLTFACVSLMSAEDFTICLMLCHTSYRVKELHKRLDNIYDEVRAEIRQTVAAQNPFHTIFRRKLNAIFAKQQKLHSFIAHARAYFTYQIFYCLVFQVLMLCVVAFQFQSTDVSFNWVKNIFWLTALISEFLLVGYFGQMLTDACAEMQQKYYMCRWEEALFHGDSHSNKLLLNDVRFAIMNAQSPVVLDGLKFLSLTHKTLAAAFQTTLSYYMFLNTMDSQNRSRGAK